MADVRSTELDGPVRRGKTVPRRKTVTVRVTEDGMAAIDRLAEREQRNRSDMVRILLQRGVQASR